MEKKKDRTSQVHDSVIGAAAAGAAAGAAHDRADARRGDAAVFGFAARREHPAAGMAAEEVDPIAEADVYMAYGRDAQAEEILKEALQKDASRIPVHAKLLEIYAKRKDSKAFEQSALKLKGLTNGAGPEWEKAAALGSSIDPATASTQAPPLRRLRTRRAREAARARRAAPRRSTSTSAERHRPRPRRPISRSTRRRQRPTDTGLDFDVSGVDCEEGPFRRGDRRRSQRAGQGRRA